MRFNKEYTVSYLEKIKGNKYRSLFLLLNPNSNGRINKNSVFKVQLSPENYALIGRIVEELIELDEELNFEEFSKAVDILQSDFTEKHISDNSMDIPDEFS